MTSMNMQRCQQCCSATITMLLQHCSVIIAVITCQQVKQACQPIVNMAVVPSIQLFSRSQVANHEQPNCCFIIAEQYC